MRDEILRLIKDTVENTKNVAPESAGRADRLMESAESWLEPGWAEKRVKELRHAGWAAPISSKDWMREMLKSGWKLPA